MLLVGFLVLALANNFKVGPLSMDCGPRPTFSTEFDLPRRIFGDRMRSAFNAVPLCPLIFERGLYVFALTALAQVDEINMWVTRSCFKSYAA